MSTDDDQEPTMDPLQGMGERAAEAAEEYKERGKEELEEEKQSQE